MPKRHSIAALLFLLLLIVLTNPLILHIWNAVEDKQDALLNTWIMAWVGHALITNPLHLFDTNIFYPYSNTLAFSEALIPQGVLALPVTLATNNPIVAYNLVLFAMLWLDALAMYLFVFDLTHERGAGLAAGVIYGFNAFNLGNLAQIQLLSLGWLPLSIMFLIRMLRKGERDSSTSILTQDSLLFSIFFILQALSSFYYAIIGAFAVLILLLSWVLIRSREIRTALRTIGPRLATGVFLIGAVVLPFVIPYLSVARDLHLERQISESEPFSASLKQYTEVSEQNLVYGQWLSPHPVKYVGGYALDNLFPGLVAVALASLGIVTRRRGYESPALLAILAIAFILSLGPRLYLTPEQATEITMPYRWLYDALPLMHALRAPVRFDVLVMFSVAGLAGIGAAAMRRFFPLPSYALAGLIAVESLSLPAANTTLMPVASEIPPVYSWLAGTPPGVVLDLPVIGSNRSNPMQADLSNQYYSIYHWHDTPDGYSGFVPPLHGAIAYEMQFMPAARAISLAQALDVQYLIVHWDRFTSIPDGFRKERLDQTAGLESVRDFGTASVYRVLPAAFSPDQMMASLYLPQPAKVSSSYLAYIILRNISSRPFAVKPTDSLSVVANWSDGRVEETAAAMPLVTSEASVVPIKLNAPGRKGSFKLAIQIKDGVIGNRQMAGEVSVGDEDAQQIVIPARVLSSRALATQYQRGAIVPLRVQWQPLNKIDSYYSVSARIVDERGEKVTAVDRQPREATLLWTPDVSVEDSFDLRLPNDLAEGDYRVEILMYQPNDGTSVLLLDQDLNPRTVSVLGEFEVK